MTKKKRLGEVLREREQISAVDQFLVSVDKKLRSALAQATLLVTEPAPWVVGEHQAAEAPRAISRGNRN